jgi:xylulokinase
MLLLGIDLGTSSVKVSVINSAKGNILATAQFPETEAEIISIKSGWAEQSPELWWTNVQNAIIKCNAQKKYHPKDISAIGIAYQMHGLVLVDKNQICLRNSIIWCDSRSVEIGQKALKHIGADYALSHLLNSPGNFTASKLAWVKENEPEIYQNIDKIMLPGDFIAMKFTGEISTTVSALSEGIFWDFKAQEISKPLLNYFGFDEGIIPKINPVFSEHGKITKEVAEKLGLNEGIVITYKAGDQPNNALSLNVSKPGEVAATAGTSGVIYAVTDQLLSDHQSRVNTFAHVNYTQTNQNLGVLLCINGVGSMYRWTRNLFGADLDYSAMNLLAENAPAGSDGLIVHPFGNGSERMLNNIISGTHLQHIDLNKHGRQHIFRAVQEGIAFAFRYGLDILKENGLQPNTTRAGYTNMFLSPVFTQTFANVTGVEVALFESDGSYGAALGAGIGSGVYHSAADAFQNKMPLKIIAPNGINLEQEYQQWKALLQSQLSIQ